MLSSIFDAGIARHCHYPRHRSTSALLRCSLSLGFLKHRLFEPWALASVQGALGELRGLRDLGEPGGLGVLGVLRVLGRLGEPGTLGGPGALEEPGGLEGLGVLGSLEVLGGFGRSGRFEKAESSGDAWELCIIDYLRARVEL